MTVDYSVYLVTDNTPAILGDKDIVDVVRAAVAGGRSLVQMLDQLHIHFAPSLLQSLEPLSDFFSQNM